MPPVKDFCFSQYNDIYNNCIRELTEDAQQHTRNGTLSEKKLLSIEKEAQKEAIKNATMDAIQRFPDEDSARIWHYIYEAHIHRKSGISEATIIDQVISANQSWKKSSGHAFEEMIKLLGNNALYGTDIEILLQRDLNTLIKAGEIANEPRDISWLKEQIKHSVFDLYAIVTKDDGRKYCFGCIQSKTSIRDRVTRDREPSIQAMESYFWSTIIVLDGDFLRLPKFISMVNGGTVEYPSNGWHEMYVFSSQNANGRIYSTDLDMAVFKEHAVQAANYWSTQRQWFTADWNVTD